MNIISKESLSKLSIAELEGKLTEVKQEFTKKSSILTEARQKQILKNKAIRGGSAKRRQELIRQILQMQKQINKVDAKIASIKVGVMRNFEAAVSQASQKVTKRRLELKQSGSYKTGLTNYEKVLAWCGDMGYDQEDLEMMLEFYTIEELAEMSGDEFYDEVKRKRREIQTVSFGEEARKAQGGLPEFEDIPF